MSSQGSGLPGSVFDDALLGGILPESEGGHRQAEGLSVFFFTCCEGLFFFTFNEGLFFFTCYEGFSGFCEELVDVLPVFVEGFGMLYPLYEGFKGNPKP